MSKKKYVQKKGVKPYSIPIEYRKLTREDFLPKEVYQQFEKVEIEADTNGYVKDALLGVIDNESDTTVVNVGTGQGKSTAIIEKIREYYNDIQGCPIIIASPTRNLVEKYYQHVIDALKNISSFTESEVVDYRKITQGFQYNSTHRILIATINLLLGNPGEERFLQSQPKREYLRHFRQHCKSAGRKVILVFDEIHEGIENFQPELYPNLLTWREITQKVIVLSATYTEPAIVVIKQLAALTRNKVRIIESERVKVGTQAKLHLVFIREEYSSGYINPLYILNRNIQKAINQGYKINILCYSKTMADNIAKENSKIAAMFTGANSLNLVTSESVNNYDPDRNNVGTTFRSGVNIDNPNNVFLIILPYNQGNDQDGFNSQKYAGIFTGGAHEIIQAVARVRNGGNIILVAPVPTHLINGEYLNGQHAVLPFSIVDPSFTTDYFPHHEYKGKISLYYNWMKKQIKDEIKYLDLKRPQNKIPDVHYPTLDEFMLSDGQRYLTSYYEICGYRTTPFAVWAALNNQFSNCVLDSIAHTPVVTFKLNSKTILQDFMDCCFTYFRHIEREYMFQGKLLISEIELTVEKSSDKKGLEYLLELLEDNKVRLDGKDIRKIRFKSIYEPLIRIVRGINIDYSRLSEDYSREDYIHDNLAIVSRINDNNTTVTEGEQRLYSTYNNLFNVRNRFLSIIHGQEYLFTDLNVSGLDLPDDLVSSFETIVNELNTHDQLFKHGVFRLRLDWNEGTSMTDKKVTIYRRLKELFVKLINPTKRPSPVAPGERKNVHSYSVSALPNHKAALNLNFSQSYVRQHIMFWKLFQPSPVIKPKN